MRFAILNDLRGISLLLCVGLATGCVGSQIGKLTMKQAVADYGPPLKTENISAEETRATWLSDSEVFNIFIAPNGSEVVRTSRGTIKAFWVLSGSMGREGHIPDGAPIGTVRSGNIFWYRILTFQENGLLKKSEEKSDIVWAK